MDEFPRDPGRCLMLYHGIAGGKTYGMQQPYPYHDSRKASYIQYVVSASKDTVPLVARQCGVSVNQVLPLGSPRTDKLFGKRKGDGGTFLGRQRAFLYAPTYRTVEETPLPMVDWGYLDRMIPDGSILVVKRHMMTAAPLVPKGIGLGRIVEVDNSLPTTPYLIDCDALITDYSSLMFDAFLLGKPVILFEKTKGYSETRGMCFEYPSDYSSRYATDEEGVISMLDSEGLTTVEERLIAHVAGSCDGKSVGRVCSLIRELL